MTGYGRRGKPKAGFPPRPQPLEIANNAIPTFPQPLLGVEKWKTKSRFPTFPLVVFAVQPNQERKPSGGSLRSRLQAHPSIRKCYVIAQLAAEGVCQTSGEGSCELKRAGVLHNHPH